jgi:hypothetical protein
METTMRRRKVLAGLGSLAAGSAAVMGSGAFSFVQANRDINARIVGDQSALLKIDPAPNSPNGQYAYYDSGDIKIDFTQNDQVSGSGLNDRAFINFENVLRVTNQGTQEVNLSVGVPGGQSAVPTADFSVSGNPEDVKRHAEIGTDPSGTANVGVGDANSIGFFFNLDASDDIEGVLSELRSRGIAICASTDDQFARGIFPGQS